MFHFTIRDVLWLMVVVAMGVGWYRQSVIWQLDKKALINEHEAALANKRRIGELRAKEAVETLVTRYTQPRGVSAEQLSAPRNRRLTDEPTLTVPLSK